MKDKQQTIKKITAELKKIPEVKAVYLFGSYARGEEKPISDIDLCVITERDIPDDTRAEILAHSWKDIDTSIIWDLPPVIRIRVFKEGKPLYIRDEIFNIRVKVETFKAYQDIKPLIQSYCRSVLGAA